MTSILTLENTKTTKIQNTKFPTHKNYLLVKKNIHFHFQSLLCVKTNNNRKTTNQPTKLN